MKGGSSNSGRAPDPNSIRNDRSSAAGWTHLPAQGRQGPPPPWPLATPSRRELDLWEREWRRPQAVMWEANGQEAEVALYVRSLKDAEKPKASVAARTLVKQQQESLGISLPGLARNRWIIASTSEAAHRPTVVSGGSAKERLSRGA